MIFRGPQVVLQGLRDPITHLWTIGMMVPPTNTPTYATTALTATACLDTFAHSALATTATQIAAMLQGKSTLTLQDAL
jgi:hypothetical protein